MPDGSNDADFRNRATNYQGTLLWLKRTRPSGEVGYASAVRLNSHYALTAGHVVINGSETNTLNEIGTGINYLTDPGATRGIAAVTVHPNYVYPPNYTPDIAIIKFDHPLPGTDLRINSCGESELISIAGYGRFGTPSTGIESQDGNARAWQAPVDFIGPPGFDPALYIRTRFSIEIWPTLPSNGKGVSGDSGGPCYNSSNELVGIDTAQTGGVLTHGKMLPGAGVHQGFVDSRSKLPSTVKNFRSFSSITFFKAKGLSRACSARSRVFVAWATSGLSSNR